MNRFSHLLTKHTSDKMNARQHALVCMVVTAGEMSAADPRLFVFCSIYPERDVLDACIKAGLLELARTPSERGEDAVTVRPRPFGVAVAKHRDRELGPALRRIA